MLRASCRFEQGFRFRFSPVAAPPSLLLVVIFTFLFSFPLPCLRVSPLRAPFFDPSFSCLPLALFVRWCLRCACLPSLPACFAFFIVASPSLHACLLFASWPLHCVAPSSLASVCPVCMCVFAAFAACVSSLPSSLRVCPESVSAGTLRPPRRPHPHARL